MHPGTNKIVLKGRIWTIDSWDNEKVHIRIVDEDGDVIAEKELTQQVGQTAEGATTVDCPDGVDGWADAYHDIAISMPYD
jgi:hypothetical protein